jgi:hypothetical protein
LTLSGTDPFNGGELNPRGGQRLLLAIPIFLFLAPLFLNALGYCLPLSSLRSQVSAIQPFSVSAFCLVPVEQRSLGLLPATDTDTDKNLLLGAPACTWRCAGDPSAGLRG